MENRRGSWRLYAHEDKGLFWHPGAKRWVELHGLEHPIVPVLVTENPNGGYWGWLSTEKPDGPPSMIWPSRVQFYMCFPYGPDEEEARGRGRRLRMRIERREETEEETRDAEAQHRADQPAHQERVEPEKAPEA